MQQKFKIGDKVKVLTNVYPVAYGTEGVVKQVDTKSSHVYVVEHGICDGQMDCMYGHFDHDAWRYCFYESELELVEDKPKFKIGDLVVHPSLGRGVVKKTEALDCNKYKVNVLFGRDNEWVLMDLDIKHYNIEEHIECLLSKEPSYEIGQEVYVSNDFNRYLRKGVLLNASPRNGLMHVNIGGFDCYVEEERVYTKEMKGN